MADSSVCWAVKQQHRLPCSLRNVGWLSSLLSRSLRKCLAAPSVPRSLSWFPPPCVCRGLWTKLARAGSWPLLQRMWGMYGGRVNTAPLLHSNLCSSWQPPSLLLSVHMRRQEYTDSCTICPPGWCLFLIRLLIRQEDGNQKDGESQWDPSWTEGTWGVKADRAGERRKSPERQKLKHPRNKNYPSGGWNCLRHEVIIGRKWPNQLPHSCPLPPLRFLSFSHNSSFLLPQVFPRWFCWTQRVTWSRDRAAWRCSTTRSADSFPGTPGPCWSSASPTLCSSTRGPASYCLWVSGRAFMMQHGSTWGSAWSSMRVKEVAFMWSILNVRLYGKFS